MSRRDNIDAFSDKGGKPKEGKTMNEEKKNPSYLKGNYKLDKDVPAPVQPEEEARPKQCSTEAFETFARERLGGSIAFVMKQDTFVWKGPPGETPKKN